MRVSFVYFALFAGACGGQVAAKPGSAATAASDVASASPATGDVAAPAASDAPSAKSRRPLAIVSTCADVAYIAFGDAAGSGGKRSIAPSSEIEAPRNADGTQIIWLVDPDGQGLAHVTVSPRMKRVEIGRSCRTLDAR